MRLRRCVGKAGGGMRGGNIRLRFAVHQCISPLLSPPPHIFVPRLFSYADLPCFSLSLPLRYENAYAAKRATECDQRDVCWGVRCCSSWAPGSPETDATLAAQDAVDGEDDESVYNIADTADITVTKEAAETMEDFRPTTEVVRASTSTVEQSVALGAPDTTAALAHNTNKNVADDISAASSYKTKLESASQVSVMLWGYMVTGWDT